MLLFESIGDLQSLHQKVVECQNKITQKTFQLLKKPAGNARHDGETVLPENPGVESILTWNFPTQWICVTIPCTIQFLLLGFVNGLTPSNGK